jgi:hypothetical protein
MRMEYTSADQVTVTSLRHLLSAHDRSICDLATDWSRLVDRMRCYCPLHFSVRPISV